MWYISQILALGAQGTTLLDANELASNSGGPSSILRRDLIRRTQFSTRSASGVLTSWTMRLSSASYWWSRWLSPQGLLVSCGEFILLTVLVTPGGKWRSTFTVKE